MPGLLVATRASRLALAQARLALAHLGPGARLVEVRTEGDERPEPLAVIGGKGVFVKDVDDRVLAGEADLAVHSCKDIPTELHPELVVAALLPRGAAHDVLVGPARLGALPAGARVGTGSPRRVAQVLRSRPDLRCVPLRGNVPTRLAKLGAACDALVLAAAGLERLGLGQGHELPLDAFPTAPGQGAIAIVARRGSDASRIAARADHAPTRRAVEAERAVLRGLGAGCTTPLGCHAFPQGDALRVVAELLAPDGARHVRVERVVRDVREAEELAGELAAKGAGLLA